MSKDAINTSGAVRLRLPQRDQVLWQAQCLDDLLPKEHRARTLWAIVCKLDLSAFEWPIKARQGVVGRDATDRRILVALWLYASLRGIGSAHELARLCQDHRGYRWLCGGVTLNHRLLSDFRGDHADALDGLFANVIATLVHKGLVSVRRISQDGLRVRASAGSSSFRRGSTLEKLRQEAAEQMKALRQLFDDPQASAGLSARQKAAKERAARQRQQRIEQAAALIPKLQARQEQSARRMSKTQKSTQQTTPRASTSDVDARRMKMGDGGYRPALNVQIACDTNSRAIVALEVSNQGVDYEQSEPLRKQAEQTTQQKVAEHLYDGGYVKRECIERATQQGVTIYAPPKPPKNPDQRADGCDPCAGDSPALAQWRTRMGSDQGKAIYQQRAATSETINAQMRRQGLTQLTVRGLRKAKCIALWAALAYNLTLFASQLLA